MEQNHGFNILKKLLFMSETLRKLKESLKEYHSNFSEIPILQTVLQQLLDIANEDEPNEDHNEQAPTAISQTIEPELFSILPYNLWPSIN